MMMVAVAVAEMVMLGDGGGDDGGSSGEAR